MKNENLDKQTRFENKLKKQLRQHRENLHLSRVKVAQDVHKSPKAYERWELSGKCLTNIHDLLKVFQVLKFTTSEVIDLLELPPFKADELEKLSPDEDTLKRIKEGGILIYMRNKCTCMDDFTLEKILDILFAERLKRNNKQV